MSTIITSTTSTTAYQVTADTTGTLVVQTGTTPTTALTIGSDQTTSTSGKMQVLQDASSSNRLILRGQTSSSYRWNVDNNGSSNNFRIFREDDSTSANGVVYAQIDSSGNFAFNSGYGSAGTAYGCRAWINFNGTGTIAIRASGNVTSITDNGVGNYTITFTNAMPNTNYAVTGNPSNTAQNYLYGLDVFALNTGSVQVRTHDYNSLQDAATISVAVFR